MQASVVTLKPRPSRSAAAGCLPEGRPNAPTAGTGSGPEGSSLTVNVRRLGERGVEEGGGSLARVPVRQAGRPRPPKALRPLDPKRRCAHPIGQGAPLRQGGSASRTPQKIGRAHV